VGRECISESGALKQEQKTSKDTSIEKFSKSDANRLKYLDIPATSRCTRNDAFFPCAFQRQMGTYCAEDYNQ